MQVNVKPEMIIWARKRAGLSQEELSLKFKNLSDWEQGSKSPTLKKLEEFARTVYVPMGFLYLENPPDESLAIKDFRTYGNKGVAKPSPNLLDTIYACESRQDWYREYAQNEEHSRLEFIGSVDESSDPVKVAEAIRRQLNLEPVSELKGSQFEDTMRYLINKIEDAGILVMISGIVGSNTHRVLDPKEFRGFALSDNLAPIIFINGADTKAAQMFTLGHELAHLWLGESVLSNAGLDSPNSSNSVEIWCNKVAAELLVPAKVMQSHYRQNEELSESVERLRKLFKVSSLVILRRQLDLGWIDRNSFRKSWKQELASLANLKRKRKGGGNFYNSTVSRVSKRFAYALIGNTLEGQTMYRDACRLLGVSNIKTIAGIGKEVGIDN